MDFLWREASQRGNPGNVFTTSCFKKRCWGGLKIDWGGLRALAHSLAGVKTPANRGALTQIVTLKITQKAAARRNGERRAVLFKDVRVAAG